MSGVRSDVLLFSWKDNYRLKNKLATPDTETSVVSGDTL
jgi:hypothetical protein